jgi:hypothetical protein
MESAEQRRYQASIVSTYFPQASSLEHAVISSETGQQTHNIMDLLAKGKYFIVNRNKRNGIIIFKSYHAEFAGPGAIVGGDYDCDCQGFIPIGNLSLLTPNSHEEIIDALKIRRQWVVFIMEKITQIKSPIRRAQKIIEQFEEYFTEALVAPLPDEALAMLVGLLPQTVAMVRRSHGIEELDE